MHLARTRSERSLLRRGRRWAGIVAVAVIAALTPVLVAATPAAAANNGCSYGTGGPLASNLCWIDMSDFGTLTGAQVNGNTISKPINLTFGGYTATLTITVSAGPTGSVGITSAAFGSGIWPRAILGNTIAGTPYYLGTVGQPALYELADPTSPNALPGPRETVTMSGLVVKDPAGNVIHDYSLVMTDAESTNAGEGFVWSSDVPLNNLQSVVPNAGNNVSGNNNAPYGTPCNAVLSGLGTNTVTCQSSLIPGEISSSARGIVMVQAEGATTASAMITGRGGSGRQGIAFAIALPPLAYDAQKNINPNQTATLNPVVTPGTQPITGATFDNGLTTKVVPGEGSWTIAIVSGQPVATFTPETDYDGPVTTQPYTVTDANGRTATGNLSVAINTPPTTTDESATIAPNQTATLMPTSTPGTGPITGVTFDNGLTAKVVPGEGAWSISLVNGQPVATFTPEKDYHGLVTPQHYTIIDANGLTATATLSITITAVSGATANTGGEITSESSASAVVGWAGTAVAGLLLAVVTLAMWLRRRQPTTSA